MITLTQSLIKEACRQELGDMNEPPPCPARIKAIYLDGKQTEPTKAMLKGLFFESLVLGATADGTVYTRLPRNPNMSMTKDEIRIRAQAALFENQLRKQYHMDLAHRQVEFFVPLKGEITNGENYRLRVRIDAVTSFMNAEVCPDPPHIHPAVILDVKLTANINSDFGKFTWSHPELMDHTQAYCYSWGFFKKFKKKLPFFYAVMDYKPNPQHLFVRVRITADKVQQFLESMRRTVALLEQWAEENWPMVSSRKNCENCPLQQGCPKYSVSQGTVTVW